MIILREHNLVWQVLKISLCSLSGFLFLGQINSLSRFLFLGQINSELIFYVCFLQGANIDIAEKMDNVF